MEVDENKQVHNFIIFIPTKNKCDTYFLQQ